MSRLKQSFTPFRAVVVTLLVGSVIGLACVQAEAGGEPISSAVSQQSRPESYNYKSYQDLVDQLVEAGTTPGIALGVYRDGKSETVVSGVRRADGDDKLQKGDIWITASIGKPITSTLIAMLIDEGKFDWDTTLSDALPDTEMLDAYKSVSVKDLLQHRGGIQPYTRLSPDMMSQEMRTMDDPTEIRSALIDKVLQEEPVNKPGTAFAYSNAGYAVLTVIAERATGKEFKALMQEYVFDRLGLDSAMIKQTGEKGQFGSDGQPMMHRRTDDGFTVANMRSPATMFHALHGAGSGISMNVGDFLKFGRFHLDGMRGKARIISQETFDMIHKLPEGGNYACGWASKSLRGAEWQSHNGGNGMMHAELHVLPDQNMVIASIANAGETSPGRGAPYQAVMSIVDMTLGN